MTERSVAIICLTNFCFTFSVELQNLRTLKMNNTRAFEQSHTPVLVPDSRAFNRLLDLDIARTPIQDDDLISLLGSFKTLRSLNLTTCPNLGTRALEQCVQSMFNSCSSGLSLHSYRPRAQWSDSLALLRPALLQVIMHCSISSSRIASMICLPSCQLQQVLEHDTDHRC